MLPTPHCRDAFLRGYASCYEERSFWADEAMVEGTIPPELEGTLLRNGPGLFEIGGKKVRAAEGQGQGHSRERTAAHLPQAG